MRPHTVGIKSGQVAQLKLAQIRQSTLGPRRG